MNRFEGWRPSPETLRHTAQMHNAAEHMRKLIARTINNAREDYCAQWIALNPNEWPRDWTLREDIQFFQDELITRFWMVRL